MTYTPPTLTPEQTADIATFGISPRKLLSHVADKWVNFEALLPFLPELCTSFLDIGCGHGGLAVHLAMHYNTAICNLLDGEKMDQDAQVAGWHRNAPKPWRSARLAAAVVRAHWNGKVRIFGPDPALTIPCDLIISTFSWGFHYPILTYLPLAHRSLQKDGVVIVDVRKNTDGRKRLGQHFRTVEVISEDRLKLERLRCHGIRAVRDRS